MKLSVWRAHLKPPQEDSTTGLEEAFCKLPYADALPLGHWTDISWHCLSDKRICTFSRSNTFLKHVATITTPPDSIPWASLSHDRYMSSTFISKCKERQMLPAPEELKGLGRSNIMRLPHNSTAHLTFNHSPWLRVHSCPFAKTDDIPYQSRAFTEANERSASSQSWRMKLLGSCARKSKYCLRKSWPATLLVSSNRRTVGEW